MTVWDVILIGVVLPLSFALFFLVDDRRRRECEQACRVEIALGADPSADHKKMVRQLLREEMSRRLKNLR